MQWFRDGLLFDKWETEALRTPHEHCGLRCDFRDAGSYRAELCTQRLTRACGEGVGAFSKGMIPAQNERWQRALNMQVEREILRKRESKAAKG